MEARTRFARNLKPVCSSHTGTNLPNAAPVSLRPDAIYIHFVHTPNGVSCWRYKKCISSTKA